MQAKGWELRKVPSDNSDANQSHEETLGQIHERLEQNTPEGPYCRVGIRLSGNTIISTKKNASRAGLKAGDKIVSIDGNKTVAGNSEDITGMIKERGPDQSLEIRVKRRGSFRNYTVSCVDGQYYSTTLLLAISAGSDGNWKKCHDLVSELQNEDGRSPLYQEVLYRCSAIRDSSSNRQRISNRTARHLYQLMSLQIEESQYKKDGIDSIRPDVLQVVNFLEENGHEQLSSDLKRRLDAPRRTSSEPPSREEQRGTSGTCFAVHPEGLVLTSNHVVSSARKLTVKFPWSDELNARIKKSSSMVDIALLKVDINLPHYLVLESSNNVGTGDYVFTMGFPATKLLGSEPKFTEGSISSMSGPGGEASFYQISVPVQPGNSGGPLLTEHGSVVGIVTAQAAVETFAKATGSLPQNVNWAVKSDYAQPLFEGSPKTNEAITNKQQAIENTRKAICQVKASK